MLKSNKPKQAKNNKPPAWFQKWSDMVFVPFVKKTENNFAEIFDILKRNNLH